MKYLTSVLQWKDNNASGIPHNSWRYTLGFINLSRTKVRIETSYWERTGGSLIKSTTAKDELNMVFKRDVLVSAATMTRKERWQKSGGIRNRKRNDGVESKKKKERTAQSNLPYNRLKKQREIKCYLFTRMEEKKVPTKFERKTCCTWVLLSRSLIEPWRLKKSLASESHESTVRS